VKKLLFILSVFIILLIVIYAVNKDNITQKEIKFGSSLPLSGINKELGLAVKEGALTYFQYADKHKLLGNKKIDLISYDDQYEPELTVENLNKLLKKDES
jgi:ABC-type branched-subunit amino acid transport system substrate-binding protein